MATVTEAHTAKSLNKSPGRRRFVFKTFAQRVEEIDIYVFQSLDPLKFDPSEGSSFFLDCLVEWRELNTAEDFISFYEEITPLVQTLPQIVLHKELILSKLLSRLQMKGRLSLEPILRLIAALSRDLLDDFPPFLRRVADSLASLLSSGADREPEIIEQIFTSLSYIMMYLQKYLVQDVVHILRVTAKLRYYHKEYVQEFMAEAVSFLLRNAPIDQLEKGIRKVMVEVAKKPLVFRKSGVSALLWYVMRGASSKLHSRAEQVLRLLTGDSIYGISDKFVQGSQSVVEVVTCAFQRLCEEIEPTELKLMWNCLFKEMDCLFEEKNPLTAELSLHLSRLLSLLISTVHGDYIQKINDYQPILKAIGTIMQANDQSSEVVDKILQLMLCILDGLHLADQVSVLSSVSVQWAPVFKLRNSSLLTFIKQLLLKDPRIVHLFRSNILSTLNDLIETSEEEVILLLLIFCERMQVQVQSSSFLALIYREQVPRICMRLEDAMWYWINVINQIVRGDSSPIQLQETKLALLWGIISCYPYMEDIQATSSLLLKFVDSLDGLWVIEYGFHKRTWQSLIGAALSSYNKLCSGNSIKDLAVGKFLQLGARYRSSPQILSAVADFLDSMDGSSPFREETSNVVLHPELKAEKTTESLCVFAENLCHSDKMVRLSTLRVLCHYQLLHYEQTPEDEPAEKEMKTEVSQFCSAEDWSCNVLQLLLSIEDTPLSITTSRKVILLISRIQMGLSGGMVAEIYLPSALYGVIGIFHNRFSSLWDPASDCIAVLITKYFDMTWDRFVHYVEQCVCNFLASHDQSDRSKTASISKSSDLVERFDLFVSPAYDSTPCTTVLSLLIQSLQKVPTVVESRSHQIVPLFLKFMGYNVNDDFSVGSFNAQALKSREWTNVLKEWLTLFKLMKNPKSFYRSQVLKEVLQYRLLDENDAEIQMKVLDCLLNWKDEFLVPYDHHLKNLISSKSLREELTTWRLSRESNFIEQRHRSYLVPLVTRILIPKVRKLKTLASRKHTSLSHRKAVLGFVAQLDVDELRLFFALLIKPLVSISQGFDGMSKWLWSSSEQAMDDFKSVSFLSYFTVENILALSWKKRDAFLHVTEDILGIFDELHVKPYLDLLMGCVVRILWSCTSIIDSGKSSELSAVETPSSCRLAMHEKGVGAEIQITTSTAMKQFKELRSFCLKIISLVLNKYEDHELGCEFWDLFFNSVKPLIDGFKQEGASSEKPSSLFSCFLSMSGSHKLTSLLYREKNLVSDIFSILTVPTASEAILSCVLKFIENLLNLDCELDHEDNATKRILLPNLDALICDLHCLFKFNNAARRKLVKCPGERELSIFKLLSKYIKDPSAARKFVDIMLPLLTKGLQNSDACVEALHVIRQILPVLGSESTTEILNAVSPLLISVNLDVRMSVFGLLDALAGTDSSLITVAKHVRELNSTSAMEMGGLEYDSIISAYEKINKDFFYSIREKHALVILSHAVHDMSSEELILRQSGFKLLVSFVDFSAEILSQEIKSDDQWWSELCIQRVINKFFFKHMGDAMNKEASIQKVWIELLREMVSKLPMVPSLKSFKVVCSEDAEQDFFNNIMHLQKHRRARALSRFRNFISSANLSEVITMKVFVPLFFNMLMGLQKGKAENIRSACLEALASITGNMEWKSYYAFLMRCFREMTQKSVMQKVLLRLICSVLDHFHFMGTHSVQEANDSVVEASKAGTYGMASTTVLHRCSSSAEATEIQACLHKSVLPKIQNLLTSDSDDVNVHISVVALKLLKLLPGNVMELQLPSIVHRIANFLKNRLESIRDEARGALAACLKELGLEYLHFIVKVLRATLKRGYELHVLGYTLNFILAKFLANPISGKLDYCLEELLSVVERDIFGDVSEEKEVEKIASKMKETRKLKSFETLKLIAQNITFKTHAMKLLEPVTTRLQKHLTPKVNSKLESILNNIAAGIECNPSVNQTDLFIFLYDLIENGITHDSRATKSSTVAKTKKQSGDGAIIKIITSDRLIDSCSQSSHLMTVFALGLLHNCMKKTKPHEKDEQLLSLLDPFVRLLTECLTSKYEDIISAALRCLTPLVGLPLPALKSQGDKIKTSIMVIAQGLINSSPLMQSCLRLLTVLLRNPRITLSIDQLHIVVQFPLFIDLERNPSFIALSLLKAIVNRKLVVHEIYDLISRVAELMVTSQVESIRKICSQILLQFLLDYSLSGKRLLQHLNFLLSNLSYEHSSGRESVLEMLHAIVIKFPSAIFDEHSQSIFVHLVFRLANDNDNKVRSMAGAAIKLLLDRVSPHSLHSILECSFSWYSVRVQDLWSVAAQVLGLLVDVMKKGFQKHIDGVLPTMRSIFQSTINVLKNERLNLSDESTWKGAYYSLILLEKILYQFDYLCLARDLENIWEMICELLIHPHMWLRIASNRLVALYFASVTEANRENHDKPLATFFLMSPSRLFFIAVSLCCQLKASPNDSAASTLITQNLTFAICAVHSLLGPNKLVHSVWPTLEHHDQSRFLEAFHLLDSAKGGSMFASLTSGDNNENADENSDHPQSLMVSCLLKRIGKIALEMEAIQMKIVFNVFKSISPKIINPEKFPSEVGDVQGYGYLLLLPLYKVCEGYAGKVIPDDVKQVAQEALESVRDTLGMNNFVQVYSHIRKKLKAKRDKRKQKEKVMAVVNPMRNAKRKRRISAKNQANKKRKVMTMRMTKWMR